MSGSRKFVVVGGGLAGALMAARLGQAGHRVEVYERRPDLRKANISAGKSINLAISARGLHAVEQIGIAQQVLAQAVPMRGRMMHSLGGDLSYQPYGLTDADVINSVSRGGLNAMLLDAAERSPHVTLHFDCKCVGVDLESGEAQFVQGPEAKPLRAQGVIIGSDGAFSAVRSQMQRLDRFNFSQSYLEHGYKELHIPPAADGSHRMERNALHIWPRRAYMMIALPNMDGSYTVTCFWPFEGPNGFNSLRTDAEIRAYFQAHFPDAVPLMPTLAEDYRTNPASSLVTMRCGPWYVGDRVVLLGDAAHAVVPFYGQGMNAAFEDCTVLSECLARRGDDLHTVFREYYESRKPNADALADLAIENFVEMRDKVGSKAFLRKKAWEKRLARLLPGWYRPLYSMVSFSLIPYGEAVQRARHQDRVLQRAAAAAWVFAAAVFLMVIGALLGAWAG
jgi:kynurenine 3-monooxygenase